MRRGRGITGGLAIACALAAFLLYLAPGAGAATPQEVADAVQNGSTSNLSLGDLQRYAEDPTVQGYSQPPTVVQSGYCTNAQGQPVNSQGQVVSSPAEAAPMGQCYTPPQVCRNAQGQPVNSQGQVVSSESEAAPMGQCYTPQVCRNAQGQPLNSQGQVVSSESEAAPVGQC